MHRKPEANQEDTSKASPVSASEGLLQASCKLCCRSNYLPVGFPSMDLTISGKVLYIQVGSNITWTTSYMEKQNYQRSPSYFYLLNSMKEM